MRWQLLLLVGGRKIYLVLKSFILKPLIIYMIITVDWEVAPTMPRNSMIARDSHLIVEYTFGLPHS